MIVLAAVMTLAASFYGLGLSAIDIQMRTGPRVMVGLFSVAGFVTAMHSLMLRFFGG